MVIHGSTVTTGYSRYKYIVLLILLLFLTNPAWITFLRWRSNLFLPLRRTRRHQNRGYHCCCSYFFSLFILYIFLSVYTVWVHWRAVPDISVFQNSNIRACPHGVIIFYHYFMLNRIGIKVIYHILSRTCMLYMI